MSFELTEEQKALVKASTEMSESSNVLKVEAFAGASKTTSLVEVSKANKVPSLYLTFNKAMAEEARQKFPHHVECRTIHSIAYREFGRDLQHKLSRPRGRYVNMAGTASEVALYFKIKPIFTDDSKCAFTSNYLGLLAIKTVNKYEQSKDKYLQKDHVPTREIREKVSKFPDVDVKAVRESVFKVASKLWNARKDTLEVVLSTHDTYLKLYQLSEPTLHFDMLYIDESQDVNPVMLDIVLKQPCKKIFVGDTYQSIYQFRGAMNALGTIQAPTYTLSRSFRFGQEVADLANDILSPANKILGTGSTNIQEVDSVDITNLPKGSCLLFRTNMGVMLTGIELISEGIFVDMPDNISSIKTAISSAISLKEGNLKGVKHISLIPFASWDEFKEASSEDPELRALYNLTKGTEADLKRKLAVLNRNDPSNATYILRTAHGAKGLEWDTVMVMDDFSDNPEDYLQNQQEANLLYVATTRAIKNCYYNPVVKEIEKSRRVFSTGSASRADMANFMLEQQLEQEMQEGL